MVEVRDRHVRWSIDGSVIAEGDVDVPAGGHFGIRMRTDRSSRLNDVRIVAH
jgi:hypothetical protein